MNVLEAGLLFPFVQKRLDHQYCGLRHYPNVHEEANIPDIIGIPLITAENAGKSRGGSAASPYLGHTCDTWTDQVAESIVGYDFRKITGIFKHMGPGTDDAHMSKKDIYKLGDLVDASIPKEPSDAGNPGVIADGLLGIG